MAFTQDKITDDKRFVRGEQLLCARNCLRVRDHCHHASWRVMMLPGETPQEEIAALRHLMPKAHVTAVDRDESPLLAAIDAGADEIVKCDLSEIYINDKGSKFPNQAFSERRVFDLVVMDLCSNANPITKDIARTYQQLLCSDSVLIFNFSYGRDVAEAFELCGRQVAMWSEDWNIQGSELGYTKLAALLRLSSNRQLVGRLSYLFSSQQLRSLFSVMLYMGTGMPMCSVLFNFGAKSLRMPPSFVRVGSGDFEIAVTCPDPTLLYATPQERIDGLRRKNAALKAVYTRSQLPEGRAKSRARRSNGSEQAALTGP